jgi:hypothetical protein
LSGRDGRAIVIAGCCFANPKEAGVKNIVEQELLRTVHPMDVVEQVAEANSWECSREEDDELQLTIRGMYATYIVSFNWMEDIEALHLACAIELSAPAHRLRDLKELVMLINEQVWVGHFDYWQDDKVVLYRHSHLMAGGADIDPHQCVQMVQYAFQTCDLYFQALQFVTWAGKSAKEALEAIQFETVGEA